MFGCSRNELQNDAPLDFTQDAYRYMPCDRASPWREPEEHVSSSPNGASHNGASLEVARARHGLLRAAQGQNKQRAQGAE